MKLTRSQNSKDGTKTWQKIKMTKSYDLQMSTA